MNKLNDFKDVLNKRLFQFELLELRRGVGETARLVVKDQYRNKKFMQDYSFDDLFEIGVNNALFTDRAKTLINELADENDLMIGFMYSQSIIMKEYKVSLAELKSIQRMR